MSRYKPPQRRGSTYITPEGKQCLRSELHQLWKVERPQVTSAVHEAAKNGDRSFYLTFGSYVRPGFH